ncbi:MAG: hypothetical protein ACREUF_17085, partial [Solimonas sp.]
MSDANAARTATRAAGIAPGLARPIGRARLRRLQGALSVVLRYVVATVAIVVAWHVFSVEFDSPILFPGPMKTAERALELIGEGRLQGDILISLQRIFVGFL